MLGWSLLSHETSCNTLSFTTAFADSGVRVLESDSEFPGSVELDTPERLEAAGGRVVFTGTGSEAQAYMADRREKSNNYVMEGVVGVGILLVVVGLIPNRKRVG